jgi:hypothetical protein
MVKTGLSDKPSVTRFSLAVLNRSAYPPAPDISLRTIVGGRRGEMGPCPGAGLSGRYGEGT